MTKKDFFRVIIKLFGLYTLTLSVFSILPSYLGYAIRDFDWYLLVMALATTAILLCFLVFLLFKADWLVNQLKLDQGFDEERIELGDIKEINILKLATLIIGGLLLLDNLPSFLRFCYESFRATVNKNGQSSFFNPYTFDNLDYFQFTISGISLLMGYLLITNFSRVSEWLLKADRKNRD